MDHLDELIGCVGVQRARILLGIDQMGTDVVFDHFGHQAGDPASNAGDHMHDALASGFFGQRSLDRFDLTANSANAREQLFLFPDRVRHDL
jgi:hypothetical protein